ncbi:hypothetical protein TSUD_108980 [Trifolium subterraneum]|nr:hypothetical protein TSUD_108980 [Trifolium subterraneum]
MSDPAANYFPGIDHKDHNYDGSHQVPVWPFIVAIIIIAALVVAVFLFRAVYTRLVPWRHSPVVTPAPEIEMQPNNSTPITRKRAARASSGILTNCHDLPSSASMAIHRSYYHYCSAGNCGVSLSSCLYTARAWWHSLVVALASEIEMQPVPPA